MNRNRMLFPLILIAIGVIILLSNTGVLSQAALQRLGDLWPLLLVIIGLQLVLNYTMPRQQATLIGIVASAVIVIAAVVYATLAPATTFGSQQVDSSQPVNGLTSAALDVSYTGAVVEVQAANLGNTLYKAHIDYPGGESAPEFNIDRETGTVQIQEGSAFPFHLFGGGQRHILVTLTTTIPWSVQVSGGAGDMRLDVRELQVSKIDISGGAHRIDAQLPSPRGTVAVDVSGGANDVTLRAPAGSQWRVSVSGGVSAVTINGSSSGGFGDFQKESSGYGGATDRLNIDISGGASHVDFRTG